MAWCKRIERIYKALHVRTATIPPFLFTTALGEQTPTLRVAALLWRPARTPVLGSEIDESKFWVFMVSFYLRSNFVTLLTNTDSTQKNAARNTLKISKPYPHKKYRAGIGPYIAKRIRVSLSNFCLSIVDMVRKTKGAVITPHADQAAIKSIPVV
jgi:hypothetical protein